MIALGDITKIHGDTAPIVDIITGGSPCQDLSIAGGRAGLAGSRSGLFMEQIRIIKEMRNCSERMGTADIRPRYMVWENVPGAFSSNKGEDFRAVLEETARIIDKTAVIPRPPKNKWTNSGCIMGDGWSIAWRVHDAQFWGVPQRRKRIALVADFGGETAAEILFERKSVCGDIETSGEQGKGTARTAETGADKTISFQERAGCEGGGKGILIQQEKTGALSTLANQYVCNSSGQNISGTLDSYYGNGSGLRGGVEREVIAYGISAYESNAMKSNNPYSGIYEADTARTLDNNAGSPACNQGGIAVCFNKHRSDKFVENNVASTMVSRQYKDETNITVMITAVDCRNGTENEITNGTLQAKSNGGISNNLQNVCRTGYSVRRLTPLECERLQGYPDGWTDIGEWTDSKGKKHKNADSPRYKALGNSIALPFWQWLAERICKQYDRQPTMASLFDGIGGFPLVFTRAGAKPVWSSEIEEFPMAVTRLRFGGQNDKQ